MIEFDELYRKELINRLPLVYFFAKKKVTNMDNSNYSTVIIDSSSDTPSRKVTKAFRKPITKMQL